MNKNIRATNTEITVPFLPEEVSYFKQCQGILYKVGLQPHSPALISQGLLLLPASWPPAGACGGARHVLWDVRPLLAVPSLHREPVLFGWTCSFVCFHDRGNKTLSPFTFKGTLFSAPIYLDRNHASSDFFHKFKCTSRPENIIVSIFYSFLPLHQ